MNVYERALRQMRELIRQRRYVMTLHAEEEMNEDGLTIYDVERIVLTGSILERQTDNDSGEWKYLITGWSIENLQVTVVGKVSITDKLVIITVYAEG